MTLDDIERLRGLAYGAAHGLGYVTIDAATLHELLDRLEEQQEELKYAQADIDDLRSDVSALEQDLADRDQES